MQRHGARLRRCGQLLPAASLQRDLRRSQPCLFTAARRTANPDYRSSRRDEVADEHPVGPAAIPERCHSGQCRRSERAGYSRRGLPGFPSRPLQLSMKRPSRAMQKIQQLLSATRHTGVIVPSSPDRSEVRTGHAPFCTASICRFHSPWQCPLFTTKTYDKVAALQYENRAFKIEERLSPVPC